MTTSGIKLSNLSLRDGDHVWRSFPEWGIGDMVKNGTTPTAVKIGDFFKHHENYITFDSNDNLVVKNETNANSSKFIPGVKNLRLSKSSDNKTIYLQYKDNNNNWQNISSVVDLDINTTYTLALNSSGNLVFTPSTGSATTVVLPKQSFDVQVENYYAKIISQST